MLFATDDEAARSLSAALALALRSQGVPVADPEPSRVRAPGTELHYFFTEDAEPAADLARMAGLGAPAVKLADMGPRRVLRPGAVEIVTGRSRASGSMNQNKE